MAARMVGRKKVTIQGADGSVGTEIATFTIRDPNTDYFDFLKVTPTLPITVLSRFDGLSSPLSILFWFMTVLAADGSVNGAGWIRCRHQWLMEDLSMHERTVRRCFTRLCSSGILEQMAPRETTYRLAPGLAMKGSSKLIEQKFANVPVSQHPVDFPSDEVRKRIRKFLAESSSKSLVPAPARKAV